METTENCTPVRGQLEVGLQVAGFRTTGNPKTGSGETKWEPKTKQTRGREPGWWLQMAQSERSVTGVRMGLGVTAD